MILALAAIIGLFCMAGVLAVAPGASNIVTGDVNSDGTIDKLVVTFSGAIEGTTDGTGFAVSGSSCLLDSASKTGAAVMTLNLTGCDAGTSITPSLSYNSSVGDINEAGNGTDILATFGPTASIDGAAPVFTAERTGTNTILVTFSENVDADAANENGAWAVGGATTSATTDPAGTDTLTITTTGLSGTSATPLVTYTPQFGTIVDDAANDIPSQFAATAADGISPTVQITYSSNPVKAGLLTITATYSENIAGTPEISIDQQGDIDTADEPMAPTVGTSTWAYNYTVVADDGSDYLDGNATVSLSSIDDTSGNTADAPTGTTFLIDTIAPTTTTETYTLWPSDDPYTNNTWTSSNVSVELECEDGTGSGCTDFWVCYGSIGCDPTEGGLANAPGSAYSFITPEEGIYYFRYLAADELGNVEEGDPGMVIIKYDATGPVTTVNATTSEGDEFTTDSEVDSNITFVYDSCTDEGVGCYDPTETYYCYDTEGLCDPASDENGSLFEDPVEITDEGTYYFRYLSYDLLNNIEEYQEIVAVIDRTDPVVNITSPAENSSSNSNVNVRYTVTEANTKERCWWTLDGGAVERNITCGTYITHQTWAKGEHTVEVYAEDRSGNVGSDTVTFTKTSSSNENAGAGGWTLTGSDAGWTFTLTLNNEQMAKGWSRALTKTQRFKFRIDNEEHSVGVVSIVGTLVTVQVSSTPQTATLQPGQSSKFDVNNDGYYEVYVRVNSVSGGAADVTVQSISEKISSAASTPTAPTGGSTPQEDVVPTEEVSTPVCTPDWNCGLWSECAGGQHARVCMDKNACTTASNKPAETEACVAPFKLPLSAILIACLIGVVVLAGALFHIRKSPENKPKKKN